MSCASGSDALLPTSVRTDVLVLAPARDAEGDRVDDELEEDIGMPKVYHAPETVREADGCRPSAASVPGIGIFGIVVRTVNLTGS
jgi:hypothetical protein